MEVRARLNNTYRDLSTGKVIVSLELDYTPSLDNIAGKDLRVEIKEWRERRSKDANAYFHKLCQLIADVLSTSLTEVKNQMIIDYGQFQYREDGNIEYSIKPDGYEYLRDEKNHYMPTQKTRILDNGQLHRLYLEKRGSHTYDSKEMSLLIDGTISEAKELGIDTITDTEKREMLERWGIE